MRQPDDPALPAWPRTIAARTTDGRGPEASRAGALRFVGYPRGAGHALTLPRHAFHNKPTGQDRSGVTWVSCDITVVGAVVEPRPRPSRIIRFG